MASSPASGDPAYLLIGEVLRPHGVAGEIRMRVLTGYPERLPELDTLYLATAPDSQKVTPYALQSVRMHQGYALIKLRGIDDRTQADRLRELFVMVSIKDAIPLEDGEYYLYQLIGLKVQTSEGELLGTLTEVLETGANDVYIVNSPQYGEVLIPATDETIIQTDLETGTITVKLPTGLLPAS